MRILVVQTAFIGDQVLTTPLLRELRRLHPSARIVAVTTKAGAELFAPLPWLDAIRVHRKRPSLPALVQAVRLGRSLAAERFDVAVVAHRSHRSALIARLAAPLRRIGFAEASGRWCYTERVPYERRRHATERYLALADPLGGAARDADRVPRLTLTRRAVQRTDALLRSARVERGQPLLCLAPGSVWPTKRWGAGGFASVARAAKERGLRPLLLGSSADAELCAEVAALAGEDTVTLAGRTRVDELVALLARAVALVGNDSGPAHIAAAVGTPTVTVFGATVPALGYAPLGSAGRIVENVALGCRPCGRHGGRACPLGHFRCMVEIPPARVLRALDELLDRATLQRPALLRPG